MNDQVVYGRVYLIMFSSGVIKVGRSLRPGSRIFDHEVSVGSRAVLRSVGGCGCQENEMIGRAQNLMGSAIQGREWFYGNSWIFEQLSEILQGREQHDQSRCGVRSIVKDVA